ncbi:T9SS type A sorting domain-containing protein [Dokdonia ponticola]|uniref:T9SS type A sorting domain-containing protein n=1 Tax=Dokdonia ponticola TaxID=2041041 RepID=A0ABV9HYR3_9FLAO
MLSNRKIFLRDFEVKIVDINGRIVSSSSEANGGNIIVLNLSNLRSALYFLLLRVKHQI